MSTSTMSRPQSARSASPRNRNRPRPVGLVEVPPPTASGSELTATRLYEEVLRAMMLRGIEWN